MSKDDATWLNVGYVCFLAIAAYIFYKAVETAGIQLGWIERFEWFTMAASLTSVALGGLATWYIRHDTSRHEYLLAAIGELRKVTWPNWPDTKRMTIVVCVVVGVFAVILSVFDILWARLLNLLIA